MGIEARSLSVSVGSDGTKRKHEARAIKRHSRDMEFDVRDQRCKSLQRMTRDGRRLDESMEGLSAYK